MAGNELTIRGQRIGEDANGYVCLDDIWVAAKGTMGKQPKLWRQLRATVRLIEALTKKVVISYLKEEKPLKSVIYANRGRGQSGTYAHPILATAYAGYLHPKLEIEVREVWLRYRVGDPTLADEILENATDEANRWVAARADGRVQRRKFTDVLKRAGVSRFGYALNTNAVYRGLFDKNAEQIKQERQVARPREGMSVSELARVAVAEGMASERIVEEECRGDEECVDATSQSTSFLREAIEKERASRKRRR